MKFWTNIYRRSQHQTEVEAYLEERRTQRDEIRKEVESRFDPQGIRDRLLARRDRKMT